MSQLTLYNGPCRLSPPELRRPRLLHSAFCISPPLVGTVRRAVRAAFSGAI